MSQEKEIKKAPKHLQPLKPSIIECAALGMSRRAIIRKFGLGANTFKQHPEMAEWYTVGREQLAEKIMADILEASPNSYLDRKLLAEKLNLFSEPFVVGKVSTPAQARTLIATGIQKYCANEISEISLNTITKSALAFIESYNQTVLQKDLAEIRKQLKGRK